MSLIINHNLMAMNAARNLGATYGKLSNSVQRLSSGLRINSSADDAAGLAIREMMRADIVTTQQGLRNAADAISLIQTADGALGVIDEKLIRMKELAEQAATGTYTTAQRDIINSEYQAMAKEIDRIANATNFNGVKLLDGSITNQHGGQGLKIHFGVSNDAAEDYYFVNIGDARATSKTGLRVGGDAKNDIWGQGAAGAGPMAGPGCCTAGFTSLEGAAGFTSGQTFSYGYNWDWTEDSDAELLSGKYLAGRYTVAAGDSLQDLVDKVNLGTQSRVGVGLDAAGAAAIEAGGTLAICLGDEAYYWGSATAAQGGTVTEQIHEFAYKYDTGLVKAGDIVASGALRTLLQGATGVNVEAAIRNAPSSAAAVAALNTKVAEALNGRQMLSAVTTTWGGASAASVALAQSFLHITTQNGTLTKDPTTLFSADTTASAGTAFTDTDFGRLGIIQGATNGNNIGTQIYTDGGSNWTTSATLATDLGWAEKKITINTYDSSATIVTKLNNAWNGLTRSADGTVTTSANIMLGWGNSATGQWTSNSAIAQAMGWKNSASCEIEFAGGGTTIASVKTELNTLLGPAYNKEVTNVYGAPPTPIGLGIYSASGSQYWTADKNLADKLGFKEVTFEPTINETVENIQKKIDAARAGKTSEVILRDITTSDYPLIDPTTQVGLQAPTERDRTSATTYDGLVDKSKKAFQVGSTNDADTTFNARALASAINGNSGSQFWAMLDQNDPTKAYIFLKEGGDSNSLLACEVAGSDTNSRSALNFVNFENLATGLTNESGTTFSLGGEHWGTMKPIQTKEDKGNQVWNVTLEGRDVGKERDLWITAAGELVLPNIDESIINGMDRYSFVELQNADDAPWPAAGVRTQSDAQAALDALTEAITRKDKIRADLGAMQNRLENTMSNLEIQSENLQASESRISDVDVAKEMTEFTKNNVLTQAAVGMLAQANSISQLALSLIR